MGIAMDIDPLTYRRAKAFCAGSLVIAIHSDVFIMDDAGRDADPD